MEMCCCKLHLHGCWCINALLKIADKLGIPFLPSSYENFFAILYANCTLSDTYIPWECTPNKKVVCKEITNNFSNITEVLEVADETTTVPFTYFEKQITCNAKGEVVMTKLGNPAKRLVPVKQQANCKFLIDFMKNMLPEIIFHRNMLKLYRNIKGVFLDSMQCAYIDIDFSENLTIGIKWEPQSLHWSKKQVTIHSGIFKYSEEKVYHP